jgi:aspartate/methionine/tyrosine aminotransferase
MAGARIGFLAGPRALMRGCLQLKAALTRLNTNLVAQHGALAALRDPGYLPVAEQAIRANLAHLEDTLAGIDGVELAVRPRRGLACAIEIDPGPAGATARGARRSARRGGVGPLARAGRRAARRQGHAARPAGRGNRAPRRAE